MEMLTVALSSQDFRSEIFWGATERVGGIGVFHVELAQAEIAKCNVASVVE